MEIVVGLQVLNITKGGKNNSIIAQLGDVVTQTVESDGAQWIQHAGFASIPSNAVAGVSAAETVVIQGSNRDYVIASRDPASQAIYGNLKAGESTLYAAGADGKAQGRVMVKADGSINLYTKQGNTAAGQGMGIFVSAADDTISILNSVGNGIQITPTGVNIITSGSSISVLQAGGIKIISTTTAQLDGANIVLGSTVLPLINAALTGLTGMAGKPSAKVLIE